MRNDLLGQLIEDYRLIRLIGKGTFGEVYLAEHVKDETLVAIKILFMEDLAEDILMPSKEKRPFFTVNTKNLFDFLNEARSIRLEHPYILRIRDFGIAQQGPFLVMEYIANGNLRQRYPRGSQLPWETIVPYVRQVAAALQFIHDHGIVHRDVKPENMLIGRYGELLLSDFGIATTSYTWDSQRVQEPLGTLSYIAPEQINAQAVRASDQYSLGAIIYEWLQGGALFVGTVDEVMLKHLMAVPPPLHTRVPGIPPQVEAAVLKALSKDPKNRFASMNEFVAALEDAQRPVIDIKSMIFCGHSAGIRALAWSPDGKYIASAGRDKVILVWEVTTGNILSRYQDHIGEIWSVAWSPDSRYIVSASDDQTVQVWEAMTGHTRIIYDKHTRAVFASAFSPDGRFIASAGDDCTIRVWETATGKTLSTYRRHGKCVCTLAWSPDGKHLASGGDDTTVHVWEITMGIHRSVYSGHADRVTSIAWSPDGQSIASASDDQTVQVWEVETRQRRSIYKGHRNVVAAVHWSPDGKYLASGSWDKTVQIWQIEQVTSLVPLSTHNEHTNWVNALAWSPDSRYLASGSWDKTVHVFSGH